MYQLLKGAIPSRKCSIKAPAKWRNSVYALTEICHQRSKCLGHIHMWYKNLVFDQNFGLARQKMVYNRTFEVFLKPKFNTQIFILAKISFRSYTFKKKLNFFSAEDADSKPNSTSDHKIEGAFCVWTHDELEELLKKELFKGSYSVSLE